MSKKRKIQKSFFISNEFQSVQMLCFLLDPLVLCIRHGLFFVAMVGAPRGRQLYQKYTYVI